MLGDKSLELIKEIQRAKHSLLPYFNEELLRQVLDEVKALFEQNQSDVNLAVEKGEQHLYPSIQVRHAALERNKRCLLAYLNSRLNKISEMRWEFGSVLPPDIRSTLCEQEAIWFSSYSKSLAKYMRSIGENGLDLTQDLKPPKSLYIEVRCKGDHGEFETEDGNIILLKNNSQHFMLRSEAEQMVRTGILEHVVH